MLLWVNLGRGGRNVVVMVNGTVGTEWLQFMLGLCFMTICIPCPSHRESTSALPLNPSTAGDASLSAMREEVRVRVCRDAIGMYALRAETNAWLA